MAVISVQTDKNVFKFGTQSLKVTAGATGNNAIFPSTDINVSPGETRTFSCYVKTNGTLTGNVSLCFAQGGLLTPILAQSALVTNSASMTGADASGWVRVIVSLVVPTGVFTLRPFILYTLGTAGEVFWVDGVKFELGAVASEWMQNIVSQRAVVDQSGAQVDSSLGGIFRLRASTGGARDTVALGTHGLTLGGDTEVYSPAAGDVRQDGPPAADARHLINAVTGQISRLLFGVNSVFDARLSRSAAKTITLDDGAGGALTAVDFLGSLARGNSGTSFPASPATNDRFRRTDVRGGMWFFWDGTRWLSEEVFVYIGGAWVNSGTYALNMTATSAAAQRANTVIGFGTDIWLLDAITTNIVNSGGTALGASHNWVGTLNKVDTTNAATSIATLTINSGLSAPTWHTVTTAINALLGTSATFPTLRLDWAKTGTPGDLSVQPGFVCTYRIVQT